MKQASRHTVPDTAFPAGRLALYLFAAALVYRFFDTLAGFALTIYAAAVLAVALDVIMRRLPLQRKIATAIVGISLFAVLGTLLWFLGSMIVVQLRDLLANLPEIQTEVRAWLHDVERRTGVPVSGAAASLRSEVHSLGAGGAVLGHARGFLHSGLMLLVIIFGALFALAGPNQRLLNPLLRILPDSGRDRVRDGMRLLAERLVGWLQGQLLSMLAVGTLATAAFFLIGVPYALLLGVLNGLLDFIPLAGPWIGGVPAVVVAAVDDPMKGIWTAAAVVIIQQIENAIVLPLAMANRAKLHPFVTLFSLVLFGSLFGFMGILLAVPLALLIWTAVEALWVEPTLKPEAEVEPVVLEEIS